MPSCILQPVLHQEPRDPPLRSRWRLAARRRRLPFRSTDPGGIFAAAAAAIHLLPHGGRRRRAGETLRSTKGKKTGNCKKTMDGH